MRITVLYLLALLFPATVLAQQGTCGTGVTWELNDNTLTISGNGDMFDFTSPTEKNAKLPSWDLYKDQIKNVIVTGNVTKIGDYSFYQYTDLVSVELGEGVKVIGNNAFQDCVSLSKLLLPETLEEIGIGQGSAFAGCNGLRELTLPVNVKFIATCSFVNCRYLEKIYWKARNCTFGQSVLGNYDVFRECPITEVDFGKEVQSVPEEAFMNIGSLSKITTQGTIEYVGEDAFTGTEWLRLQEIGKMVYIDHAAYIYRDAEEVTDPITLVLAEGTTGITGGALRNNRKLVKVVLPSTLKRIGDYAFNGCTSLGEVEYNSIEMEDKGKAFFPNSVWKITFGNEVKKIPSYLLYGCSGLNEINLPESLEIIGEKAFSGCGSVKELTIPDKVEKIGRTAIYDMANLGKLSIGEGLKELDYYYAFGLCPKLTHITWNAVASTEKAFDPYHKTDCCKAPVNTLVFGDKVEYVPGQLFFSCSTLTSITLGKSVKTIGEAAFRACTGLKEIDLPVSLETIGKYAFYGTGLETLIIPCNVTLLDAWALGTSTLKTVISTPTIAPVNVSAFIDHSDEILLYVPDTEGYKSEWGKYSRYFRPMIMSENDELYYDGTIPKASFSSNIPDYKLISVSEAVLDGNAGTHSIPITASFSGTRDFTVNLIYHYTVNKGIQQIVWDQTLEGLRVGDEVILNAYASSGLDVTFLTSDTNIKLIQKDDRTIMVCKGEGEVELKAQQSGNDNWLSASTVTKKFTISATDTGIDDIEYTNFGQSIDHYYDISGRILPGRRKGISIIRRSDGSVHKVLTR